MNRIINQIKTLGLMAIMFAVVASLAGAGSASASSLPVDAEVGQVLVKVAFDPSSTARQARVEFFNEYGQPVAKALTDASGQAKFEFPTGTYKVRVSATGYVTVNQ